MAGLETTLAMIKPDAVRHGHASAIEQAMVDAGFVVVAKKRFQFTSARAAEFYKEHLGKKFYKHLVGFMSSGPAYALALSKENAVADYRTLVVDTLRPKFGTDQTFNAVHGSDSAASARRELRFHFPQLPLQPLPSGDDAKAFVSERLQPTLVAGLTALCRARPAKEDAVAWLAVWLRANNPNVPERVPAAAVTRVRTATDLDDPELHAEAVLKIQTAHRRRAAKKRVDNIRAEREQAARHHEAATRIQAVHRGRAARKHVSKLRFANEDTVIPDGAGEGGGDDDEEVRHHKAATRIQAVHRGRRARKHVSTLRAGATSVEEEEAAAGGDDEEARSHQAATRIQAVHRGRAARKHVSTLRAGAEGAGDDGAGEEGGDQGEAAPEAAAAE